MWKEATNTILSLARLAQENHLKTITAVSVPAMIQTGHPWILKKPYLVCQSQGSKEFTFLILQK
jgi:hypothetical protein